MASPKGTKITMTAAQLKAAIASFCDKLTAVTNDKNSTFHCDYKGSKYLRIVRSYRGSRSVHTFVKAEDGSLWKPKGWKGPALNFSRGNVFDIETINEFHGR